MPRFAQPSFGLSRAGFVQPGTIYAEDDTGVTAWLALVDAGRIPVHAGERGPSERNGDIEQDVDNARNSTV